MRTSVSSIEASRRIYGNLVSLIEIIFPNWELLLWGAFQPVDMIESQTACHENWNIYSVRRLFTGLAMAALIAWKLTVSNAINKAVIPAIANTDQLMVVRYA